MPTAWDEFEPVATKWDDYEPASPRYSDEIISDLPAREQRRLDLLSERAAIEADPEVQQAKRSEDFYKFIETPLIYPEDIVARPGEGPETGPTGRGITRGIAEAVSGLTTPQNIALLGLGPLGRIAGKVGAGLFGYEMASAQPQLAQEAGAASVEGTEEERALANTRLGINTVLGGLTLAAPFGGVRTRNQIIRETLARELESAPLEVPRPDLVARNLAEPGTFRPQEQYGVPRIERPPELQFEAGEVPFERMQRFGGMEMGEPQILPQMGPLRPIEIIDEPRPLEQRETRGKVSFGAEAPTLLRTAVENAEQLGLKRAAQAAREAANAREVGQAAEVHGDLRTQSIEGEAKVPAQEGGAGVQPQAQGQPEVLLEPPKLVAAVRTDTGKTYTGMRHPEAQSNAIQDVVAGNITVDQLGAMEQGFVDVTTGQFLTRAEAAKARGAQVGELTSEMIPEAELKANVAEYTAKQSEPPIVTELRNLPATAKTREAMSIGEQVSQMAEEARVNTIPHLERLSKEALEEHRRIVREVEAMDAPTDLDLKRMQDAGHRSHMINEALEAAKGGKPETLAREKAGKTPPIEEATTPAAPETITGSQPKAAKGQTGPAMPAEEGLGPSRVAAGASRSMGKILEDLQKAKAAASKAKNPKKLTERVAALEAERQAKRAELDKLPKRQQAAESQRPYDLIDMIEDQLGGKISLASAREIDSQFKPTGAARKLFAKDGHAVDIARQAAEGAGRTFDSPSQFLEALNETGQGRKTFREKFYVEQRTIAGEAKEASKLARKQAHDFNRDSKKPGEGKQITVPEELQQGDSFDLNGTKVTVKDFDFDADGNVSAVVLEDGKRYGTQVVERGTVIHFDEGTAKPAPAKQVAKPVTEPVSKLAEPAKPTIPAEPAKPPKLGTGEKGTGELFKGEDQPFNLAGEKGIDTERVAAERAAAEQRAAEAKAAMDKQQTDMFSPKSLTTPPDKTLGVRAPGAPLIDVSKIVEKVKGAFRKFGTSRGNLPADAFAAKQRLGGLVSGIEKDIKFATRDLVKALREQYGIKPLMPLNRIPPEAVKAMNDYLKGELRNPEIIPDKIRAELDNMRALITSKSEAIIRELEASGANKGLIDTVKNNLDVYLTRSYRFFDEKAPAHEWYKNLDPMVKERAQQFLIDREKEAGRTLSKSEADSLLLNWLSDLKDQGRYPRTPKVGSKDLSIFMKRKQIAPEIRAILGEYNDPMVNFARSMTKMGDWLGNQRFLNEVKKLGEGKWLFTDETAPPGFNARIAGEGSETMSPLNGLRTSPEIAEVFNNMNKTRVPPEGLWKLYLSLNAITKQAATTQSMLTQMRNLTSQPAFFGMAGHWQLGKLGPTMKAIAQDLGVTKPSEKWRAFLKEAAEYGIVGDTARASELREILNDAALNDVAPHEIVQSSWAKLAKKAYFKLPAEIYKLSDEIGKIYGWQVEQNLVRRVHPEWSEAQVKTEAARRVRDFYPTYSMVPEWIKQFRKAPIVGPFVSFPYEAMRTSAKAIAHSIGEIRSVNPVEQSIGRKRLASQMATLGTPFALAALSKVIWDVTNEQEEDLRRFQPPWARNSQYLYMGRTEDGKIKYLNLSYQNPYAYYTDMATAAMSSARTDEPFIDASARVAAELARPFVSEQMLANALLDVSRNKTESGREIYNEQDDLGTKADKVIRHVALTLAPGTAQRIKSRIGPSLSDQQPEFGRRLDPKTEIAAEMTGLRLEQFDFKNALSYKARQFAKDSQNAENIFRSTAGRTGTVSEEQLLETYGQAQQRRFELWSELRKDYLAALRNGVSEDEAVEVLQAMNLPKNMVNSVVDGEYAPWMPGGEIMERMERMNRPVPEERMFQIFEQYDGRTIK